MTFLDRIKETSTSTGTGTFTLSGAAVGYKAFTNGTYKYCIVNSTETEWEVGEGTVASGVLTRTTIEASSNAGSAVNFSAGTKYVFNTVSAAYVNSLVPYTGATASVNLGEFGLTAGQLTLDTTPTGTAVVGTTQWNDSIGSSQTLLKGGNVLLKNGVDLVARVVNKVSPATTLTKATYKAVRVSGAQGQRLAIAYAQANTDNNSADTIGLVCETIAANQEGFIITVGQLLDVNTTGSLQGETWADGDVLYLSPTTAGNLTNIKPNGSTGHIVVIGYVEYAHSVHGSIYVKIMNGWEISELHDCYINSPANNQVLTYESATDLWKNKSIATILGYTPQAAITLTTTGSSGAATFVSNTLNIPTVTLAGLGGISLTSLSASSPLSYNNTTGAFSIQVANTSQNGYLSSTDWNTFNGKQGALTLTTTGTSGAATLIGNTLNIPQYSGGGITGSGTSGQVTYWSGTSAVTGSSNLFWDNTNGRLGIGTSSPLTPLHIISSDATILLRNTSSTGYAGVNIFDDTNTITGSFQIGGSGVGALAGNFFFGARKSSGKTIIVGGASATQFATMFSTGNLLIQNAGTHTDNNYRLDINGTGATTGALRVTGGNVQFGSSTGLNWDNTNGILRLGDTAYTDSGSSKFVFGVATTTGASRITIATGQSYMDFCFVKTGVAANTHNAWSFGQRFDTYFGNASGSFQIVGGYTSDTGGGGTYTLRVPLICNPNGDVLINGSNANSFSRYIGLGVNAPTALTDIGASTTSRASLRIRSGTAPTSPNDGDIWYDGTNIYLRVGGTTKTFTLV